MNEAEILFSNTFMACNSRFAVIFSFREISRLGLPVATLQIYDQYLQFSYELFNDPKNDKFFIDKQGALNSIGGVEALGSKMAQDQLKNYKASVDAASLIFAHSILDNAVWNYCKCCALVSHIDWQKFVTGKKFTLDEILQESKDELLARKVNEYVESLDRESIIAKAQKLFEICQPPAGFSPLHNYNYDNERLKLLDDLRHEIIHKSTSVPVLPSGDDDIRFLQNTANYYMAVVNEKYKLKLDPSHIMKGTN